MSDTNELPEWCRPGADLAATSPYEAIAVKVLRVEGDAVVVDHRGSEERYRPWADGRLVLPDWNWDWTLRPVEDPKVRQLMASQKRRGHIVSICQQADLWGRNADLVAAKAIADELVKAGVIASYQLPEEG